MSFEGKNLYGQYIDYSEKKMAQGLHLPLYWDYFLYHSYIQQISGERLQDHWSSCLIFAYLHSSFHISVFSRFAGLNNLIAVPLLCRKIIVEMNHMQQLNKPALPVKSQSVLIQYFI